MGVASRICLAAGEAAMQARLRTAAMDGGTTLVAPETVFLAHDTRLGRDGTVHPHVVFGSGVTVDDGVEISSCSHMEGARNASGARVGPSRSEELRGGKEGGRKVKSRGLP